LAFLDLDHFGTKVGEHCGRYRSLLPDRQIEDANAAQWRVTRFVHNSPLIPQIRQQMGVRRAALEFERRKIDLLFVAALNKLLNVAESRRRKSGANSI
jgi:hypothetical protein